MVTKEALAKLDLDQLGQRTEGFVARDLEHIVSRAVHAHILKQGRGKPLVQFLFYESD